MSKEDIRNLSGFVWSIAEILRGDFKQSEYGKVILPFVVLRRLDCMLKDSKDAVLSKAETLSDGLDEATRDAILFGAVGENVKVYNLSRFTFETLRGQDPGQLHDNLMAYIVEFSGQVRDIFLEKFRFTDQLQRLKDGSILWNVFERFCNIDLHPNAVSNLEMGYLFEELIRRFSEISNETAGEHFTPREVIRLIVDLLVANDDEKLTGRGIIRQVYDPACGTGGMLALTEEALKNFNDAIRVELFGQELNGESFGICQSDMLVTGHDPEQIACGNTLVEDAHAGKRFHYMLSNPPYGVDWAMSDPNQVYDLEGRLFKFGYLDKDEIERFSQTYFKGPLGTADRPRLEGLVRQAVARFEADDDEGRQEEFRQLLKSFNRFYAFVAQIVALEDTGLEKLASYGDWLSRLLPNRELPPEIEIAEDMLRLQAFKVDRQRIPLPRRYAGSSRH